MTEPRGRSEIHDAPRSVAPLLGTMSALDAGNTHGMASLLSHTDTLASDDAAHRASVAFRGAIGVAATGALFFLMASYFALSDGDHFSRVTTGLLAGSATMIIAFALVTLALRQVQLVSMRQMAAERTARYLLANTMCEHLDAPVRDQARARLIDVIANAPILAPDGPFESVPDDSDAGDDPPPPKDASK